MLAEAILTKRQQSVRRIRAQLLLTQEQLRQKSGVSRKSIYNAEHGEPIRWETAYALLKVFNAYRRDLGWRELEVDELDWKISEKK